MDQSYGGPAGREQGMLKRLLGGWSKRVKQRDLNPPVELFNRDCDDFPERLLPFAEHPLYSSAPHETRQHVLTCAWLAYNRKAVDMEERIVGPACIALSRGDIPGATSPLIRQVARACFVDEGAHIHLLHRANRIAREARGLEGLRLKPAHLAKHLELRRAHEPDRDKRGLLQLAAAIVAEISITDYLGTLLQPSKTIQPLNRAITEWHRKDELAHAGMFRNILGLVYRELDQVQRNFLIKSLYWARQRFFAREWESWRDIFEQLKFPNGTELLAEAEAQMHGPSTESHLKHLHKLLQKIDLSFAQMTAQLQV